jgi:glycosyltransferase 2 family protein
MKFSSKKALAALVVLLLLGFIIYRASGMMHLGDFSGAKLMQAIRGANPYLLLLSIAAIYVCYALRAARWCVFQRNLGPSRFWTVYAMTLAGFTAVFLLGRAGEPVRPVLLARKEKLPYSAMFGIYALERLFDTACTAVIAAIALLLFQSHTHAGETAARLNAAARTTGTLLFAGVLVAIGVLIYLRLHGTAMLERKLQPWIASTGWRSAIAGIVMGFARGAQTIRTWSDLILSVLYSALHWCLVVLIYYWVTHCFGGELSAFSVGDAMLVLAVALVGSAVQLPGVGGGAQVGSFVAYTAIFGVEKETATAAAIVLWLISFAACSLAGVPLLIHEGFSLGKLRQIAGEEKEAANHSAAGQGESAR